MKKDFMEKKFLRLLMVLTLATTPIKVNAGASASNIFSNAKTSITNLLGSIKFVYSSGLICDRYDKLTFVGTENGNFVKATNSSEAFCGIKTVGGFVSDKFVGDIFCGCVSKMGSKAYIIGDDTADGGTITDRNSLVEEGFFSGRRILTLVWNTWNIWSAYKALSVIFNYVKNTNILPDFGDVNINFEGAI